jgi:hypothetical protein
MSAAEKALMWREHIDRFLATVDLSDERRAVVLAYRSGFTASRFEMRAKESAAQTVSCQDAAAGLSLDQVRLLMTLGDLAQPTIPARLHGMWLASMEILADQSQRWFGASASSVVCECSIGSWCTCGFGWGGDCRNSPPYPFSLCFPEYSPSNCGCDWGQQCDGNCQS